MGTLRITGGEATVGRNPSSTVAVADPFISRTHARLRRTRNAWALHVAASVTHEGLVKHNDRPLRSGAVVVLAAGDRLTFGRSPTYQVDLDDGDLVLRFPDETERAPAGEATPPLLAFHPMTKLPKRLRDALELAADLRQLRVDQPVDVVAVLAPHASEVAAKLHKLREARFFLPIAVLGDPIPRPESAPFPVVGGAYLWAGGKDEGLPARLAEVVAGCRDAERAAAPFRTGEVLHLDTAGGRVLAHDWVRGTPRELRVSELEHQILLCMALAQRETPGLAGMGLRDVLARLEARRWARSERTIANELSVRIPQGLRAAGLHPALYTSSGTRERSYGLSTPPSCLRDV